MLVEASVVARLFRFRLLTIDARLVVSPARVHGRASAVMPRARRTIGARLGAAERVIDEGATSLAASRGLPAKAGSLDSLGAACAMGQYETAVSQDSRGQVLPYATTGEASPRGSAPTGIAAPDTAGPAAPSAW